MLCWLSYDLEISYSNVYVSTGQHCYLRFKKILIFPADELSMHLLTTPMVYRLLTFGKNPRQTRTVAVVLSTLFTVVMVTHMVMDEFLLHATTFGLAVYMIATRLMKLISQRVPDKAIRKNIRIMARFGCCMFSWHLFSV